MFMNWMEGQHDASPNPNIYSPPRMYVVVLCYLNMCDDAGWVFIGLGGHSYSWGGLRPSVTRSIIDTHVGTFWPSWKYFRFLAFCREIFQLFVLIYPPPHFRRCVIQQMIPQKTDNMLSVFHLNLF